MRIAFVFPGQGSQSVGMMAGFDAHPAVRSTFDEASEILEQDFWALFDKEFLKAYSKGLDPESNGGKLLDRV